jgi:hypothetical protein
MPLRGKVAVLWSEGARLVHFFSLIVGEAALLSLMGLGLGDRSSFRLAGSDAVGQHEASGHFHPGQRIGRRQMVADESRLACRNPCRAFAGNRIYRMSLTDMRT